MWQTQPERQDQQPPTQQPTRTRSTTSCLTPTCSFLWPLKQGALGTIRRWNWYEKLLEDGRPASQVTSGSPPSCSSSCPWHYRGGMRPHSKTRSLLTSPLQSVVLLLNYNVLVLQASCLLAKIIIIIIISTITTTPMLYDNTEVMIIMC